MLQIFYGAKVLESLSKAVAADEDFCAEEASFHDSR